MLELISHVLFTQNSVVMNTMLDKKRYHSTVHHPTTISYFIQNRVSADIRYMHVYSLYYEIYYQGCTSTEATPVKLNRMVERSLVYQIILSILFYNGTQIIK